MLYSGQAFAVSEAGEIQRKEQKTPHAEMNVAHNITNIQFAEDSNIAGQNAIINFFILYSVDSLLFLILAREGVKSAYFDLKKELKKRTDVYQKLAILYK